MEYDKNTLNLLLLAAMASGGQIVVGRQHAIDARNFILKMHSTPCGEIVLTAVSRDTAQECSLCDGLGGYGITGSTMDAMICPSCNGSGIEKK